MSRKLLDDCFLHDKDRLSHDAALRIIRERITTVASAEAVSLSDALGRALATPVLAQMPVPAHTNSAVDGYAYAHASPGTPGREQFRVVGRSAAGHPFEGHIGVGEAVRIFTGGVLPKGADTVVMQEDVTQASNAEFTEPDIHIPADLKRGANVRHSGEDLAQGEMVFNAGDRIRPQDIAALASIGMANVACFAKLKIAIVSTGDEVVRPGHQTLKHGGVYDTNAPMLHALCQNLPVTTQDLGVWPDDGHLIQQELAKAAREYDVILTSGGASRGEEDHMVTALQTIGKRHLWQLAVKPGRPMSFGQIGDTIVVGLPGNPVATFVCFLMYVVPMLSQLAGSGWCEPRRFQLPAAFTIEKRKTGRREFLRGSLKSERGKQSVAKFPRDGSGLISSLRAADGLIDIPENLPSVKEGDLVSFIPFSEFGMLN